MYSTLGMPCTSSDCGLYHDNDENKYYFSQGNGTVRFVGWQRQAVPFESLAIPSPGLRYNEPYIRAQMLPGEAYGDARDRLIAEFERLMSKTRTGPVPDAVTARYNELSQNLLGG